MAYNIEFIEKKGLEAYDVFVMELISQGSSQDMTEPLLMYLNDKCLQRLLTLDIITTVKKKRKADHDFKVIRLNKKGKGILLDARKIGYTAEDGALFDHISLMYEQFEKPLGNPEKVKELLGWFRTESGYTRRQIFKAIRLYLKVQDEDNKGKYISSLENLLWKSDNVFSTKWKLSDSKLYQFIHENKHLLNANKASQKSS